MSVVIMVPIHVLVVTDNEHYQEALVGSLSSTPDLRIVGSVAEVADLLPTLKRTAASLVLLDMSMRESRAILRLLGAAAPTTPVLGLGVPEVEQVVIPMIEAGLAGYLPRSGSIADLHLLIRSLVRGETIASPQIVAAVFEQLRTRPPEPPPAMEPLTARERQIAGLLKDGCSNKSIAIRLGIRLPTVKKHVHSILQKLHVESRAQVSGALGRSRGGVTISVLR